MASRRGFRTIKLMLTKGQEVSVYTSPRIADALEEISADMDVYQGVKLGQLMEAVYKQGEKDGARKAFTASEKALEVVRQQIKHLNPGRPPKK